MASYDDLSDAQQAAFASQLQQVGLSIDRIAAELVSSRDRNIFSCHADQATIVFDLSDVRAMKACCGRADGDAASGVPNVVRPPVAAVTSLNAFSADRGSLGEALEPLDIARAAAALRVWHYGDSREVEPYEGLINTLFFPRKLAVYAARTLTIDSGVTVQCPEARDALILAGAINFIDGGYLEVRSPTQVKTQILEKSD